MQTILHTAKRTFSSAVIALQLEMVGEFIDGKRCPVRTVLPALPASLPSQSTQSDEYSSDSDDIDDCSETYSIESENDDKLFLNEVQSFDFAYFIS